MSVNLQMCRQMPVVQKSFFFYWLWIFFNKPFCTFVQNVAIWYWLGRSSYPQLHWIVSLIPFPEGGLENILWSWQTFPLTDLHTSEHLCMKRDVYQSRYWKYIGTFSKKHFIVVWKLKQRKCTRYNIRTS